MGLFDQGVQGIVNDVSGQPDGGDGVPFPTFITPDDDDEASFGGTCQPGTYTPILTKTVKAGTKYSFGSGAAKHEANQGYIYVFLKDDATSPAEVIGQLRLKQTSETGRTSEVVKDLPSDELHGSKSNRTQKQPLPEQDHVPLVGRDSHLVVEFKPASSSAVTISEANTEFKVPATEYDLTQK